MQYVSANLIINEIMAAPIADESLNEWIELYNNGSEEINVYGFIIGDNSDNDTIEGGLYGGSGTIIPSYNYAIITDEATRVYDNFNCNPKAIRLYIDDSSIGNGLSNNGETIYLYDNNRKLIQSINYNETDKGKCFAFLNNLWYESDCTPGYSNNASIPYQEETIDCDWKIEILLNKTIFENKDEFEWQIRASKINGGNTNTTATATITDLFGNILKEYEPWTNSPSTYQKTSNKYSPSLEEGKSYLVTAYLEVQCDDTNLNNNINQKTIIIKGSSQTSSSFINIEDIYDLGSDKTAKFGQMIRVKLNIYKGDTTKEVITAWIEDKNDKISKQSKINLYKKFTDYEFTIPIQLKPNCDSEYEDGKYKIKVEGLDAFAEKNIEVEDITDDLCETELISKESSETKFYYELIDWPLEIENSKEFEIKVKINNNDEINHEIDIWSYVYRGPKSYSGEREANLKNLIIEARSSREITLRNKIEEAEPGQYNLAVNIIKDKQKTPKRITKQINVIRENIKEQKEAIKKEEITKTKEDNKKDYSLLESIKPPKTIYESPTIKAKKLAIYIFIGLLLVYSIILTWKR